MTPKSDWQLMEEAVTFANQQKARMIELEETTRTTTCPRCGSRLNLRLAGRSHVRMGCEGKCGMELME